MVVKCLKRTIIRVLSSSVYTIERHQIWSGNVKTISVREVAEALQISTRGVLYRREKGKLKGILVKNERGVDEYRIYPTKEIIEGLKKINSPLVASPEAMEGFDVVDAQTVSEDDTVFDSTYGPEDIVEASAGTKPAWIENNRAAANGIADELWNTVISRFMEKLEAKDQLIGEFRKEIEDQKRQLCLLPDLQKQAEEERKAAELKELEAEALRKQIAAIESVKEQAEASRNAAEEELQRIKDEKEAQVTAVQEQLQALSATVQELQKPKPSWWKKWFAAPPSER